MPPRANFRLTRQQRAALSEREVRVVPTNRDAEDYRFLRLYSIDLEMAKQASDLLAKQDALDVRYSILRDLVVTYARPFSVNRGRLFKKHKLDDKVVPVTGKDLHLELLALRDQVFAHTDHDARDPQIARWPRKQGGAMYPMSFTNPPYGKLIDRLDEIRELIVSVEAAVNLRVRSFEAKFELLFPPDDPEPDKGGR